ncbi:hypothetical protein BABINDRAFT_172753 [Babjeviella inositovora NRRL Y-12698]|uniref:Altered inheritance of mitochondria protein 32 n=1 Tax=Babjeviella inositovora NRRL Y-12698 TaxID=984486 RepID=A0A1E3QJA8_9ASCO|nr:uncharacterized protein BABINDRAFT_172753 [Babjeviella inositovora NRRL Y-12698]ODQ77698.1 hypothetical protein BABINDRAFT_172753 [Babjeviella inositovora NRRL Y-12698]
MASSPNFVASCPKPTYDTGCTYCQIPLFDQDSQIDLTKPLNGTKSGFWKHLVVFTGENAHDWPSKIELQPGTLVAEMNFHKRTLLSPFHPVVVSNSSLPSPVLTKKGHFSVGLYPDNKLFQISLQDVPLFMASHLKPETEAQEVYNPFVLKAAQRKEVAVKEFPSEAIPNPMVLICGHAKRDVRCGVLAPPIAAEFEAVLGENRMLYDPDLNPNGWKVGMISHIGGHVYAGNVLIFDKKWAAKETVENTRGAVWYGRVTPQDVQGIVQETILKDNVIQELYRGVVE